MEGFKDVTILMYPICGIYLLMYEEAVVYVGKSRDVGKRIQTHFNRMKNSHAFMFNRVMVRACQRSELDRLEFEYISKFKPIHNKRNLGPPACVAHVKVDLIALGIIIPEKARQRRV